MVSSATVTFADAKKEINLKECENAADIRREVFQKFNINDGLGSNYILKYINPVTNTECPLDDTVLGNIKSNQIDMKVSYKNDETDKTQTKSNDDDEQHSNYGNFVEKHQSMEICSKIKKTQLITPARLEQLVEKIGKQAMENIDGDAFRVEFPLEQCSKDELISLFDRYLIRKSMPMPVKQLIKEKYLALLYNEHYETEVSTTFTKQTGYFSSKELLVMVSIKSWTQNHHLICVIAYGELKLPRQYIGGSSSRQYESILQRFCIEASKED
ncbi:unnamed protein product [Adineta steineri]|uniref:Uncharacterized protein n=1 Tax=Adineta steineri TaxID=433720 RepID=A0A818U4U5_9BILA|nr:unnamed protein product [Adineta steineri]